jgi:hypothetical protein
VTAECEKVGAGADKRGAVSGAPRVRLRILADDDGPGSHGKSQRPRRRSGDMRYIVAGDAPPPLHLGNACATDLAGVSHCKRCRAGAPMGKCRDS